MKTVYVVTITKSPDEVGNILGIYGSMESGKTYFEKNAAHNCYPALSEWEDDYGWGIGLSAVRCYNTLFQGNVLVRVVPFAVQVAKPATTESGGDHD